MNTTSDHPPDPRHRRHRQDRPPRRRPPDRRRPPRADRLPATAARRSTGTIRRRGPAPRRASAPPTSPTPRPRLRRRRRRSSATSPHRRRRRRPPPRAAVGPRRGRRPARRATRAGRPGAAWTIVRAAVFAQNFTEGVRRAVIAEGVLPMPVADIAEPFVDVDDIADVAVGRAARRPPRRPAVRGHRAPPADVHRRPRGSSRRRRRPTSRSRRHEMVAGLLAAGCRPTRPRSSSAAVHDDPRRAQHALDRRRAAGPRRPPATSPTLPTLVEEVA